MATMFDSVQVRGIPTSAEIVAAYVDGIYANVSSMRARFPGAYLVTITIKGAPGVRVCDCEKGDLTPRQAAAWAFSEIVARRRPTIYCSLAFRSDLAAALAAWGLTLGIQVDWWCADYVGHQFLEVGSVATQWASYAGYDISTTNGVWPYPSAPAPTPVPPALTPVPVVNPFLEEDMPQSLAPGANTSLPARNAAWTCLLSYDQAGFTTNSAVGVAVRVEIGNATIGWTTITPGKEGLPGDSGAYFIPNGQTLGFPVPAGSLVSIVNLDLHGVIGVDRQ